MWSKVPTMGQSASPIAYLASVTSENTLKHIQISLLLCWPDIVFWTLLASFLESRDAKGHPRAPKGTPGAKSGAQEPPKMNFKIDKSGVMGFKVSTGCPCAPLDHQKGTQVPKMEPSGLQNHGLGCLVTPKSSTRIPKPPKENKTELPKRKELQRTMHAI